MIVFCLRILSNVRPAPPCTGAPLDKRSWLGHFGSNNNNEVVLSRGNTTDNKTMFFSMDGAVGVRACPGR
jgi:hypothetical protein